MDKPKLKHEKSACRMILDNDVPDKRNDVPDNDVLDKMMCRIN